MAVQQGAFCGNCGAPLAPGAAYCGRCGAVVPPPVPATAAAPAAYPAYPSPPAYPAAYPSPPGYAAYPAYAYPRGQPVPGRIGRDHTTQIAVAMGLVFLLVAGAAIVSALALLNNPGKHAVCTQNCGPKIGTALPAEATFTSSTYGFQVDYDASWTVQDKNGAGVELGTDDGGVAVIGQRAGQPLDQVINSFVSGLPSATYQDVSPVTDVKGAHLGDQDGIGELYSANFITSNASAVKVRFAVIAATKNGVTVLMFALNAADTKDFHSGMPEGQKFDYMATTFRWGSGA